MMIIISNACFHLLLHFSQFRNYSSIKSPCMCVYGGGLPTHNSLICACVCVHTPFLSFMLTHLAVCLFSPLNTYSSPPFNSYHSFLKLEDLIFDLFLNPWPMISPKYLWGTCHHLQQCFFEFALHRSLLCSFFLFLHSFL